MLQAAAASKVSLRATKQPTVKEISTSTRADQNSMLLRCSRLLLLAKCRSGHEAAQCKENLDSHAGRAELDAAAVLQAVAGSKASLRATEQLTVKEIWTLTRAEQNSVL